MKVFLLITLSALFLGCKNSELTNISYKISQIKTDSSKQGSRQDNSPARDPGQASDSELDSCENYCQDINHFETINDNGYSYLAFANFGYRGIGRCRGHALLTQKMTVLAKFEPIAAKCDLYEDECLEDFRKKIYAISAYEHTTIPGFNNLYEFSAHPKIQPILKGIVAGTPNRYKAGAARIQDTSYGSEDLNIFFEIKRRLALGHYPYIGIYGVQTGHHGLVAYEDTFKDGENIICAKDPNVVLESAENCDNYFYLKEDKIFYKRWDKEEDQIFDFKLTSDEDRRVVKYNQALMTKCREDSKRQNLCK